MKSPSGLPGIKVRFQAFRGDQVPNKRAHAVSKSLGITICPSGYLLYDQQDNQMIQVS